MVLPIGRFLLFPFPDLIPIRAATFCDLKQGPPQIRELAQSDFSPGSICPFERARCTLLSFLELKSFFASGCPR